MLVEVLVEHLGARLRAMTERNRGLRTDRAGSGWRSQNDRMSVTVAFAADMASSGPR
jgi:hypothetical protein